MAFGSVKFVKIEFSIKGAQFSIKSAKMGVFYKEVSPNITKNRDPCIDIAVLGKTLNFKTEISFTHCGAEKNVKNCKFSAILDICPQESSLRFPWKVQATMSPFVLFSCILVNKFTYIWTYCGVGGKKPQ